MAASVALLTDVGSAITTGPSATSQTNAVNPANKMLDLKGSLELAKLKLQEARLLLLSCQSVIDAGDGIKASIDNSILSLV